MKTATISVTSAKFVMPGWLRSTIDTLDWAMFVQQSCEDASAAGRQLDGDALRRIMAEADRMIVSR